jgi:hypothetical protein
MRSNTSIALFKRAKPFAFFALLLLLGWAVSRSSGDWTPLLLAGWCASIFIMHLPATEHAPKWQATIESGSFVMLLALLFSAPVAGLLVIVCHGLAGQIADRFFRS